MLAIAFGVDSMCAERNGTDVYVLKDSTYK